MTETAALLQVPPTQAVNSASISKGSADSRYCCSYVKAKQLLEVTIVVSSIAAAVVAFLPPVVLHYALPVIANCSKVPYIKVSDHGNCSKTVPANRTNGQLLCGEVLNEWQQCATQQTKTNMYIQLPLNSTISVREADLKNLLEKFNESNPTKECYEAAKSLLCQVHFPLCDDSSNLYQPPLEYCILLIIQTCANIGSNASDLLSSNCNTLPQVKPLDEPVVCLNDQFTLTSDGVCLPKCAQWHQYSNADVMLVLIPLSCALGLVGVICFFIASCVRWKQMFTFPSIYLIFSTGTYGVIALTGIVPLFDRCNIFCGNNPNATVPEAYNKSTVGCRTLGVLYQYSIMSVSIWWFYHVCSISFKIIFPMHTRKVSWLHILARITLMITGWLIPALVVVATIVRDDDFGYIIPRFPPQLCTPKDPQFMFYTYTLFTDVLLFIGTCLLIVDFWLVHKYQGIIESNETAKLNLSDAERKILFLFWYYVLFGIFGLISGSLITGSYKSLEISTQEYISCQLLGNNTAIQDQCTWLFNQIDRYTYPWPFAVTYFYLAFFPVVNMVFVINWKKTKESILSLLHRCRHKDYETVDNGNLAKNTSMSINPTSPMIDTSLPSPMINDSNTSSHMASSI